MSNGFSISDHEYMIEIRENGAYSTLLTLSDGLVLESPSHVNLTFGIRAGGIFRESIESRPESSFSWIDDDAELSACLSDIGQ